MTREQELPLFEYADGIAHEEKVQEIARGRMLQVTELALDVAGIDYKDSAGVLLHTVVKLCGMGVYTRTREEILGEFGFSIRTLQRVLKRLQELGFLRVGRVHGKRDVLALRAIWSNIVALSEGSDGITWVEASLEPKQRVRDLSTPNPRQTGDKSATLGRQTSDTAATFENPSLYNAIRFHHRSRSRFEEQAATVAMDVPSEQPAESELRESAERIVQAFPRHQRPVVRVEAWELAFICLSARETTGFDHLAEQCTTIRCKQRIESPANYLRGCARGICQDLKIDYYVLRLQCPKQELPPPAQPSPTKKHTTPAAAILPEERATGWTEEQRRLIANFGRPVVAAER